ncbi:MAG: NUDIX domain-containing protein [candidate division Zixibacteria bacterium]|nr:NUDIX domain-containing protein [candidate division Zixibacteria bacterium]
MDFIKAAGGIVYRHGERGTEIVLVHRPKYDDWSLPKGKLERDERWQDAAVREVVEETQCQVRIGEFVGLILYRPNRNLKVTLFWLMEWVDEVPFTPNPEVDAIVWLPVADAIQKLDHVDEKDLVRKSGI